MSRMSQTVVAVVVLVLAAYVRTMLDDADVAQMLLVLGTWLAPSPVTLRDAVRRRGGGGR